MATTILIGRLGNDPEIKFFPDGGKLARMRIAESNRYTDRNGNRVERTNWFTVIARGRLAETSETFYRKGQLVCVEGDLNSRQYEKDGVTHHVFEITARTIRILSSPRQQTAVQEAQQQQAPVQQGYAQQAPTQQQMPAQAQGFAQQAPVQQAPVQQAPAQAQGFVQQAPVQQQAPAQQNFVPQAPAQQQMPAQQAPAMDDDFSDIPF